MLWFWTYTEVLSNFGSRCRVSRLPRGTRIPRYRTDGMSEAAKNKLVISMIDVIVLGVFGVVSLVVTVIDVRTKRIPDIVVLPALLGTAIVRVLQNPRQGVGYVVTGLVMMGAFWLVWYFSGGRLGLGDVKLAGYIGTVAGPGLALFALFCTGVVALVVCLPLIALGRLALSRRVAFGPFLVAGSWAALWLHPYVPAVGDIL